MLVNSRTFLRIGRDQSVAENLTLLDFSGGLKMINVEVRVGPRVD